MIGGKRLNSEVLAPDDEDEEEEERKKERKKKGVEEEKLVHSICSIYYEQFTGSSCYCHRFSTKVDVIKISVPIMYMYRLQC